jgi:hypothetical protein
MTECCESKAQRGSRGRLDCGQGPGGACTRTPCMAMAVALTETLHTGQQQHTADIPPHQAGANTPQV